MQNLKGEAVAFLLELPAERCNNDLGQADSAVRLRVYYPSLRYTSILPSSEGMSVRIHVIKVKRFVKVLAPATSLHIVSELRIMQARWFHFTRFPTFASCMTVQSLQHLRAIQPLLITAAVLWAAALLCVPQPRRFRCKALQRPQG